MHLIVAALLALVVPAHVNTADYWGGYGGTKVVPAKAAATALTWVETNAPSSKQIAPLGVRTLAYSDPNRLQPSDALYNGSPDRFAKTCSGSLVRTAKAYPGQVMTNPRSLQLASDWRQFILRQNGQYSAVFDDDATGTYYSMDTPCNYSLDDWISAQALLIQRMGLPVIYSGLNDYYQHGVAKEIALNRVAIGGMMEECYAQLAQPHETNGWVWQATEATEIQMAKERKWFLCYGRDVTPADQAMQSRLYTYASFLLTYDPGSSVLWEYYKTATGAHVMPETTVVPTNPVQGNVGSIAGLRTAGGAYVREYRACYINTRPAGACAVAVNPSSQGSVPLGLSGYSRSLQLQGSGIFDGGRVIVAGGAPSTLGPLQGVIVFR